MEQAVFRLLLIADVHHVPGAAGPEPAFPARRVDLAAELLRRAIEDAKYRGGFDAIAIMGDLLNDGLREDSRAGLEQLRDVIRAAAPDKPLLLVPGNHDGQANRLYRVFESRPGLHRIGPYRFMVFADRYAKGDFCTRGEADRHKLTDLAAQPGGPVVVLQHNPMHPPINDNDYPYMLTNRPEVMADYKHAGVMLSLSGHAHWGQELTFQAGVHYFTCPALCESPYRYAVATLMGRQIGVEVHGLRFEGPPPVVDSHVHTEFAFCGRNITAGRMVARAQELGLAGLVLTEHAPQLYVQADDFWTGNHVREIGLWRKPDHWRIEQFRQAMEKVRDGKFVKVGLEVEADADGNVILRDEERQWADMLIGAVHFLPQDHNGLSDVEFASSFMKTTEALLRSDVDILAHPLRLFGWARRNTPTELFKPLAQMLADTSTAAEINFHHNNPFGEFVRQYIDLGVKISFGSDAHEVSQIGNLGAHLALVQRIAGRQDVQDLLYYP